MRLLTCVVLDENTPDEDSLDLMNLGVDQLVLNMESMEDQGYLPVAIHKSFRGFLGEFRLCWKYDAECCH